MSSMDSFVIPAQARIQLLKGWTPACAGVTVLFRVFV
jgi:hypothetical protein